MSMKETINELCTYPSKIKHKKKTKATLVHNSILRYQRRDKLLLLHRIRTANREKTLKKLVIELK